MAKRSERNVILQNYNEEWPATLTIGVKLLLLLLLLLPLLLLLLLLLLTEIEFSLGGSSPYTGTNKTNKNIHKRNSTKTQNKQHKTQ